jgi:hypothetical protein
MQSKDLPADVRAKLRESLGRLTISIDRLSFVVDSGVTGHKHPDWDVLQRELA